MNLKMEKFETLMRSSKILPVKRVLAMRSEPACSKGENFCSYVYRIKLGVLLDSGVSSTLRLIAKLAPVPEENKAMHDLVTELGLFTTELKVYQKLLSAIESLIKIKKLPWESFWPRLLGSDSTSLIILLEDLKFRGYSSVRAANFKSRKLDFYHAQLVMKELGRLHALSVVAAEECSVDPADFSKKWIWTNESLALKYFEAPLLSLSRSMKDVWGYEWSEAASRIQQACSKVNDRMNEITSLRPSALNVVNHGDAWTNNILFKYNADGQPESIKFVDFQNSTYNTFAIDLTYFLYTSVEVKVRRAKYNELIEAYRVSLNESLKSCGWDLEDKTTYETVVKEMNRFKFVGFLMLISINALAVMSPNKKLRIATESLVAHREIYDAMYVDPAFKNNVEDDLKDFLKCGII